MKNVSPSSQPGSEGSLLNCRFESSKPKEATGTQSAISCASALTTKLL